MKEVVYVPNLMHNLLSVAKCSLDGYDFIIYEEKHGCGSIEVVQKCIARTKVKTKECASGLYQIRCKPMKNRQAVSIVQHGTKELGQRRPGHFDTRTIMGSKPLVHGLQNVCAGETRLANCALSGNLTDNTDHCNPQSHCKPLCQLIYYFATSFVRFEPLISLGQNISLHYIITFQLLRLSNF